MTSTRQWFTNLSSPLAGNVSPPTAQIFRADFTGGAGAVTAFTPQQGTWTGADNIVPAEHVVQNNMWTVTTTSSTSTLVMFNLVPSMVPSRRYIVNATLKADNLINTGSHWCDLVFMRNVNGVVAEVRVIWTGNTVTLQLYNASGVTSQVVLAAAPSLQVFAEVDFLGPNQVQVTAGAQGQALVLTQTYLGVMPELNVYQWSVTTSGQVKPGLLTYALAQS